MAVFKITRFNMVQPFLLHHNVVLIQYGDNIHFDQSSPEQFDHLFLLTAMKIWWSAKIGRGWSGIPIFPTWDQIIDVLLQGDVFLDSGNEHFWLPISLY
jgi:hypothetical protein